jgi:hypothetical protein
MGCYQFPPMNAAGNRHQADDNWEDIPPPVEDIAAQQQPQDPQYNNMAHYPPLDPAVSSTHLYLTLYHHPSLSLMILHRILRLRTNTMTMV